MGPDLINLCHGVDHRLGNFPRLPPHHRHPKALFLHIQQLPKTGVCPDS